MTSKLKAYLYILSFFLILSFISGLKDLRYLSTTIYDINEKDGGIYYGSIDLEKEVNSYLSYDLSSVSSEINIAFTIRNSISKIKLNIDCILSTSSSSDTIVEEFSKKKSICRKYENSDSKIVNVIASLSGFETGAKLYLNINSDSDCKITLYFRKTESYVTEIPKIVDNPYVYQAVEFNAKRFYNDNKEILLISSEANSLIFYAHSNDEIFQIDESSLVAISEQSLAAHFWDYEKVILFIGSKNDKSSSNGDINIITEEISDKNIYYYMGSDLNLRFFSFYNECEKVDSEHYLFVNYASLADYNNLYFKFHNLIGAEPLLADFLPETQTINNLKFESIYKFKSFSKTEKSIHVFKFKCSTKDNKILANIKYSQLDTTVDNGHSNLNIISDFYHVFSLKEFTLDYSSLVNSNLTEFVLEIFTINTENEKTFKVEFEEEELEMNNKYKHLFKITDKKFNKLTINIEEEIHTIISISPPTTKTNVLEEQNKYYTIYNYKNSTEEEAYSYYEIEHEYDATYDIGLEIKNKKDYTIPICYYLFTTSLLQLCSQNCFLLPSSNTKNLTFKNIFTATGDASFNIEEPKYSIIIYNYNSNADDFIFGAFTFNTNLPTSTPINKYYEGHEFLFLDYKLRKFKNTYFNLYLPYSGKENHIDLYILNDGIKPNEIEIQCISAYEIAIDFIEPLFTQDNNLCYIINNDKINTSIFHIIINNTSQSYNEKILIRVMPKTKADLNVKFVVDKEQYIRNNFEIKEGLQELEEPSVYKIYEINKKTIEDYYAKNSKKIVIYSKDEIKFYARKENDFTNIKTGNFIIIDSDILKENNYDKFLLIFGRNCENYCDSNLIYQITLNNLLYDTIDDFVDYHRFVFNLDKCNPKENYYILLNYGKKYEKNDIYISNYSIYGNIQNIYYINEFSTNNYTDGEHQLINNYQKLEENDINTYIIRFTCNKYLISFFDFFTNNQSSTEIELKHGNIQYFNLQSNTNYTFNFELSYEIKIDLLNNIIPKIYAKDMNIQNSDKKSITLIKGNKDIKSFNISTKENEDTILRIIPIINVKYLSKENINNLYKIEDKYIYDLPTGISHFSIFIKKKSSKLRLLKEENEEEMEICYNIGELIILDNNIGNCITIKDKLEYNIPDKNTKSYMVLYSKDNNQKIYVESIKNDEKKNDKKDKKGVSWVVILIIIIVILLSVGIVVFIIMNKKKKQVTSEDIEKNFKKSSSPQIIN